MPINLNEIKKSKKKTLNTKIQCELDDRNHLLSQLLVVCNHQNFCIEVSVSAIISLGYRNFNTEMWVFDCFLFYVVVAQREDAKTIYIHMYVCLPYICFNANF